MNCFIAEISTDVLRNKVCKALNRNIEWTLELIKERNDPVSSCCKSKM